MLQNWLWRSSRKAIWPSGIRRSRAAGAGAWKEVIPYLDHPPAVRKLIHTTNAIEALNSKIRRAFRNRDHFPSDDAAAKLIYLALNAAWPE